MEDVMKCQKCGYLCVDPRILRCFHTFCLQCLEEIRSGRKAGEPMPCPRCGTVTTIPAGGFRENEFVKRLIRVAILSKPVETEILCDVCRYDEEEPKEVTATVFCLECRHILCELCRKMHRRSRPCRNHQLIPFGTLPKNELETKFDLDFCEQHEMAEFEKYCESCQMVICNNCLAESHQSHRCSDLRKAKDRLQSRIFAEVEKLDNLSNRVTGKQEELEKKKTNFMEEILHTETAVKTRGQELKDLIDMHTVALLEGIAELQNKGLDRLDRQRTDLDLHSAIISSFKTYCNSLCDKGSSYDVCSPVNQIMDRVEELETQNHFHVQRHLPLPTSSLKQADLSAVLGLPNVIGEIKATDPLDIVYIADLEFPAFSVMGVAKLKNSVYVLCRSPSETVLVDQRPSNVIKVYSDQKPFTLINEIRLDSLTSPFDMAASQPDDRLYVTDLKRVSQMTSGQQFSQFLAWEWNPHTISVSTKGCVMLAKDGKPCILERYTSKASLVDSIQLPTYVGSVKHAVETTSCNVLALLHLQADMTDEQIDFTELRQSGDRGIFEVTSAGNIVRCFIPWAQSYRLDDPCHLALDSDGQIYVVDHAKDRMIQFHSELDMIQIIEKPDLFGPKRIFYDKATNQLWIGHSKQLPAMEDTNGCVNICKVTPYDDQQNSSRP